MKDLILYKKISSKLIERYGGYYLKTNNKDLHTVVTISVENAYEVKDEFSNLFDFEELELPIMYCQLSNDNIVILTTRNMYSRFKDTFYKMNYKDFLESDRSYFRFSREIGEGETRIFRYLHKKGEFMYEIDSYYPADAAHNNILHKMWRGYFEEVSEE